MKFSIKDFFSKCDQIRSFRRIWSHLLKKSLMENLIFCAVQVVATILTHLANQPAFACLNLTIETLEHGMKYIQS